MKKIYLLIVLLLAAAAADAQISLIGAGSGSGQVEIVKWQALDSSSVTAYPSLLQGYLLASSCFDAYNSNYYLTGYGQTGEGLLSFNTATNTQTLSPFTSFSNITEIDMSTGRIYNLQPEPAGIVKVNRYDIATGTDSLLGVISEPGMQGLVVDATGFDANNGILYYAGEAGTPGLYLFSIPVREPVFTYNKIPLVTTAPVNNITSLNYDNVNNTLFARNATFDSAFHFTGDFVVEINTSTGIVTTRGELTGFEGFLAGSSSFDQNTGSLMLVGADTAFMIKMIVFNTYDNTWITGFVPDASEIACDNSLFAYNHYILNSIGEAAGTGITISPNPATDRITIRRSGDMKGVVTVTLYDLRGRKVMQMQFGPTDPVSLDVSGLVPGLYTARIACGDLSLVKKVVKW